MLGEPGIGKTTELKSLYHASTCENRLPVVYLNSYDSESSLKADVFDSEAFRDWKSGNGQLELYLDSLDEARIKLSQIARILSRNLTKESQHLHRLKFRITCRSLPWSSTALENDFKELWGEDNVRVLDLLPLDADALETALHQSGIDPAAFEKSLNQSSATEFTRTPIGLNFLLKEFKQTGSLPRTRLDLYRKGCRHLCDETNSYRKEIGSPSLLPDQRLTIASQIAAVAMFTGKTSINTTSQGDSQSLSLEDIATGFTKIHGAPRRITIEELNEVLDTAIFTADGLETLRFQHQTYLEFLAAEYVTNNVKASRLLNLFVHPQDKSSIVPQLSEAAAWAADMNNDLFLLIAERDPLTLLRSDVSVASNEMKEKLVSSLIDQLKSEQIDDGNWGLRQYYPRLQHQGLAAQLNPAILDSSLNIATRRFSIDTAETCHETDSCPTLLHVALNLDDDPHIRSQAVTALAKIGNDSQIQQLILLLTSKRTDDPDDEIKGAILTSLWSRRLIPADTMFTSLQEPRRRMLGQYRMFCHHILPDHLLSEDVIPALTWWLSHTPPSDWSDDFKEAKEKTLELAMNQLENAHVQKLVAEIIVREHRHYRHLKIDPAQLRDLDTVTRWKLIDQILDLLDSSKYEDHAFFDTIPPLLASPDLDAILKRLIAAVDANQVANLGAIAKRLLQYNSLNGINEILLLREEHSNIRTAFADWFDPIELSSRLASGLKKHWIRENEERTNPRPKKRSRRALRKITVNLLNACETGQSKSFWKVCRSLENTATGHQWSLQFTSVVTKLPGWKLLSNGEKERIVAAASEYLKNWKPQTNEWLYKTGTIYFPDTAAYRALRLLLREKKLAQAVPNTHWADLATIVTGLNFEGVSKEELLYQKKLIKSFYKRVPKVVLEVFRIRCLIETSEYCFEIRKLEKIWDPRVETFLVDLLKSHDFGPQAYADIIDWMLKRKSIKAVNLAMENAMSRQDERQKLIACQSAASLWAKNATTAWNVLFREFESDPEFFRSVAQIVAHKHDNVKASVAKLSIDQLANLFRLFLTEFPDREEEHNGFGRSIDHIADLKRHVLDLLTSNGTFHASATLNQLAEEFPQLEYLKRVARTSKNIARQKTWVPLTTANFYSFIESSTSHLVRSADELQQLLLESLEDLERKLQGETPLVQFLWNEIRGKRQPKKEEELSDFVKHHFESDLHGRGIFSSRETQIRRKLSVKKGEDLDLLVTAAIDSPTGEIEFVTCIVEVKGCWNDYLKTDMETQLVNRYLETHSGNHGIYLVAWFLCDAWDKDHYQKKACPNWSIEDARNFFLNQARAQSNETIKIASFVLDTRLP
ncbi:NACHT domain-containing protein [Lacunimicrobium album]